MRRSIAEARCSIRYRCRLSWASLLLDPGMVVKRTPRVRWRTRARENLRQSPMRLDSPPATDSPREREKFRQSVPAKSLLERFAPAD